jgi:hypothetical protein
MPPGRMAKVIRPRTRQAVRRYMLAVKGARVPVGAALAVLHAVRVRWAEECLPLNPLADYSLERMIADAHAALAQIVHPSALA